MIDPDGDPHRDWLIDATAIDDLARSRLRGKVRAELDQLRTIDAMARGATAPPAGGSRRLRARFAAGDRRIRRPWMVAGLALAAVALAVVVGVATWPRQDRVALSIAGAGQVTGPPEAPLVELADGRLEAEVVPDRGTRMRVHTDEATVTVIGTGFSVERANLATTIAVRHGTVEVACVGRDPVRVTGGGSVRCLPATAGRLLRRIVALGSSDPEAVRESVDAGLQAPDATGGIRAELLAHRVRLLAAAGDPAAVDAAEAYLATGDPARRAEMAAYVGSQRFARDRCSARGALELAVAEDPGSVLAVALASCVVDADPERARILVDGVADPGDWTELASAVRARISR